MNYGLSATPAAAPPASSTPAYLPAKAIKARVQAIQDVMASVMHEGEHYYALGQKEVNLSDGSKQSRPNFALSKSGAEVLCMTFQLAPEITSQTTERDELIHWKSRRKDWFNGPRGRDFNWVTEEGDTDGYYEVFSTCRIYGPNGNLLASAQGSCNNLESKYRTQNLHDVKNTILKMSQKRAFVAAVLLATGASDLFIQDLDDDEVPKPAPVTARPASGAVEGYGSSLTDKQVNSAKGHADRLKLDPEASRNVIAAVSTGDKGAARAFMDAIFSKDDAKIRTAFEKHLAWATPAAPAPNPVAPAPTPAGAPAPSTPPPQDGLDGVPWPE